MKKCICDLRLQMGCTPVVILNKLEDVKEAFSKDAFNGRPVESFFTAFDNQPSK